MIPQYRELFNREFTPEKYNRIKENLSQESYKDLRFRISESPIFLTKEFESQLTDVSKEIFNFIKKIPKEILQKAVPEKYNIPNDTSHPHFFSIDFGICKNAAGQIEPRLIELQAFPSLFSFLRILKDNFCEVYPFLNEIKDSRTLQEFINNLKVLIIGDEHPENVILLEIYPEKQKTAVDFILTEKLLGIKTVCLTQIEKDGKQLYYNNNGKRTKINRIYNRIILEELDRIPGLHTQFNMRDEVDIQWITHPNWFFKVSKYILPLLKHEFIPKSYFLSEFPEDESIERFILKPLFSFAGNGVRLTPTKQFIDSIQDKENYILQEKVVYAPVFKDIHNEFSTAEIRLLYIWKEEDKNPILLENLVRMTKSDMINSNFNPQDDIWTGSSLAFFK
ncbi:hypothetical protein [Chryseobacterium sp.]|uniref:hypothetical protein n=1 Tax=Chryseobacterium sp. TaxID=1871047 RepID=UPI0025C085C0|nr:hypothetical protein [Chryseobacterium sp.]